MQAFGSKVEALGFRVLGLIMGPIGVSSFTAMEL